MAEVVESGTVPELAARSAPATVELVTDVLEESETVAIWKESPRLKSTETPSAAIVDGVREAATASTD